MLKAAAAALCQTTWMFALFFQFLLPALCIEPCSALRFTHTQSAELCCIVLGCVDRSVAVLCCDIVQSNPLRLTTPSVFWLVLWLLLLLSVKNGGYMLRV